MKKKLQFLFSLVALMFVATFAKAQIIMETDLTSQFSKLTDQSSWTAYGGGNPGVVGWACPQVAVNGLGNKACLEYYNGGGCNFTGDVFYATVTGLAPGTYTIELYGAAAFTFDRGFGSDAFTGDLSVDHNDAYTAGDKIEPSDEVSTGVTLYAESEGATYGGEIAIWYAQNFNPGGPSTITLSNIVVGESGSIKIGMSKTSASTNWHVIQLKSVIATVDADAALAAAVASAQAIEEGSVPAAVYSEIQQVLADNNKSYETAAEYKTAIEAINAVVSKAKAYPPVKGYLDKMAGVLDKTNVYTAEAYAAAYGDVKARYEAGTLTDADFAEFTANSAYNTGWHSANKIDDVLLSAWTTNSGKCSEYDAPMYINTWSVEGNNDGSEFYTPFFEYWTSDGNSLAENELSAYLTGIPEGEYAVEAWVRVRMKNGATAPAYGITIQANAGDEVNVCDGSQIGDSQFFIKKVRVPAVVDESGNLGVRFNVAADNNISWLSFQDVKYITAEEAAQKELDENYAAAQAAIQDGNYYEISTKVGETTYYLKMNDANTGAILTADEAEATAFQFTAQKAASGYLYENGWNLGVRFTNPSMDGGATGTPKNEGFIRCDSKNDRDTWERQVFFLNAEGEYAVRSTNSGGTTWGANTFWDVVDAGATPAVAGHAASISYVWNLTDVTEKATIAGAAEELAAAQAVVEAKVGVGDGLFFIPEEAYNTYADAVAAAAAIINSTESTDEQILQAVADLRAATATYEATEVAKPVAGQAYVVANATAEGNLSVTTGKVSVETDAFVYFTEVEGGYAISNENGEYVFKTTGNTWTLSSTENLAEAYVLTVVPVAGGYTLKGANGLIGLDGTAAGSSCYANKAQSNNGLWTISEYVAPEIADLTADMFHKWTLVDPIEVSVADQPCAFGLFQETGSVYGDMSVNPDQYADLTDWDYISIAAIGGTPRLIFNRTANLEEAEGTEPWKGEIKLQIQDTDNPYILSADNNIYVYDLTKIKEFLGGTAHLNSIKVAGGGQMTTHAIKLSTVKPAPLAWYTITVDPAIENGTVAAAYEKTVEGVPVKVTAVADDGFELETLAYTVEGSEEAVEIENGSFNMPASNVTIAASFAKGPEYVYTDLTADMYACWTTADADAEETGDDPNCAYEVGVESSLPYGNGSVEQFQFADLSDFAKLTLTVTAGTPRLLFNTQGENPNKQYIEINSADNKYVTTLATDEGTKWIIDLAAIVADTETDEADGFAHLNCIKANGWGNTVTITEMELAALVQVPEIALNCAGFSFEEGTQAEPNIYPAGSELGVYFTADNLEENLVDEDATKVKVTVMVSGDLPENLMTMGSETAHRVMGETFYIPLGETAFPVELKPGYVYQNIVVMAAELVLPGDEETPEVSLAAYAGEPIQLHWVGIAAEEEEVDPNLIEIAQSQDDEEGAMGGMVTLAPFTKDEETGVTTYTTPADDGKVAVVFKMKNVDVKDCDYILFKFAEPAPAGLSYAFWSNNKSAALPKGATELKYVFAEDEGCEINADGIIPEVSIVAIFQGDSKTLKVEGVYKHLIPAEQEIAVERMVGQGYAAQYEEIDFSDAEAYLGVDAITYDMLRMVEPDGSLSDNYGPDNGGYDGWFNAEGAKTWSNINGAGEKGVCIKLSEAIAGEGYYPICDMGNPAVGDVFNVKWAAVANDKTFYFNFKVTFVEYVEPEYKPEIVKTIEIAAIDQAGAAYKDASHPSFDVAEVCEALGIEDITSAKAYIVNVTTGNFVENTTDGWRSAEGDAQDWTQATNGYCLKLDNPASGEFNYNGAHDANFAEGDTYVAQWGIVVDDKAVLLKVTISFLSEADFTDVMTGINGVAGGKAKTEGRKYIEDGKVYIFRNGKKVLVSGIQTK